MFKQVNISRFKARLVGQCQRTGGHRKLFFRLLEPGFFDQVPRHTQWLNKAEGQLKIFEQSLTGFALWL